MTIKNAVAIEKGLGSLLKVDDIVGENKTFQSYLRVLVEIKVFDPLNPSFYLWHDQEESLWISLRYERLDFYCTLCGRVGHKQSTCRAPLEECHLETYTISLKVTSSPTCHHSRLHGSMKPVFHSLLSPLRAKT
jgi:hypothetical protein